MDMSRKGGEDERHARAAGGPRDMHLNARAGAAPTHGEGGELEYEEELAELGNWQ